MDCFPLSNNNEEYSLPQHNKWVRTIHSDTTSLQEYRFNLFFITLI